MPATTALEQATAALARRDRSAAALVTYLKDRGVDREEAQKAVDRLRAAGYVDDRRLADLRAEVLVGRGYGDAAIRVDLGRHEVDRDVIDETIDRLPPERDRADTLADRDGRTPRTARRLAAKGFGAEIVAEVMRVEM